MEDRDSWLSHVKSGLDPSLRLADLNLRYSDLPRKVAASQLEMADLNLRWSDLNLRWPGLNLRWSDLNLRWRITGFMRDAGDFTLATSMDSSASPASSPASTIAPMTVVLAPCVGEGGYDLVDVAAEEPWASLRAKAEA